MQGAFRPPDDTARRPRRSDLLFQMSRNGLLVHADNSDLSYKAILTRVAWDALGAPGRPRGPSGGVPALRGTYGLALEALSGAPLGEARRVLVAAALLRTLQEVVLADALLAAASREAPASASPRLARGVAPSAAAGFLARALTGAASAFHFARPLLPEGAGPETGAALGEVGG